MSKIRIGLQIESTSPSVRHLIGSAKGETSWDGIDPDEIVKVTYLSSSADIQEINPGIYYNIPSITTAKQGDTLFSDDGRLFVYDEAGSRWFLWYTFDNSTIKIHTNNTLTGDGSLNHPLSVNTTLFSLKGDVNPLLKGVDNGDGTFDFSKHDGTDSFTIYETRNISDVDVLRNQVGRYGNEQIFLEGYHSGIKGPGEGHLYWDVESTEDDDGGTVFKPDDGLLDYDKCSLDFNGSNSYLRAVNGSIGHLEFPVKVNFKTSDNEFYLVGRSGWLASDSSTSASNLKWAIRYYGGSTLQFFVNDPAEGIFTATYSGINFNGSTTHEVKVDDDNGDTVLYLDGEELDRITIWGRTTLNSSIRLFTVGRNDLGSFKYFSGTIYNVQVGTEIWDFTECSGSTAESNEGSVLDAYNITWFPITKGRWKRIYKGYVDVKDFGALGDGTTNDTDSFNLASNRLQVDSGGKLVIPVGEYVVGKQEYTGLTTGVAYTSSPIISISECSNPITIEGNGAVIKAADGLRYGSFDPSTGEPYTHGSSPFTNQNYAVGTYIAMLNLVNNYHVSIKNIKLYGNNENYIIGGPWGGGGRQLPSTGIRLSGNKNVHIENVSTNNHGLDGVYYLDSISNRGDVINPLTMINVVSEYNGRQGLSVVGGKGGLILNSMFSNTGKSSLASPPAAGVDLEASFGYLVEDFTFIGCEMSNNSGVAMVADSGPGRNFLFKSCKFIGTTNRALWPKKPGIVFEDCLIVGNTVNAYTGSKGVATEFHRCKFSDDTDLSPTGEVYTDAVGLFNLSSSNGVLFKDSTVEALNNRIGRITSGAIIDGCLFTLKAGTEHIANRDWAFYIDGSTLKNSTIIEDIQGTLPADSFYINSSMESIGKNTLISNNNKLKWTSWSTGAGGFDGEYGDNSNVVHNRLILSRTGRHNNFDGNRSIRYNTSEPVSENYLRGDIVFNSNASSGSPTGWICTVSGSTGVNAIFEPFGTVGGSGVQTATGDGIDNSDPQNPVWSFPTPSEIGALQPGDDITELNNNGVYLNETSHDALPPDNPHSVNIQQTYDEGSPASTSTPDNVLTTEAGVVKTTPILNYNVFNQNIRNSVTVVGTTETTILNPTTGSLSLTTNDCAANNSYELEITGELTWGGTTTGVNVVLYVGTQAETISIPLSGTGTEPIKIEAKLDFLDGVDTARTCVFTGNVIHIDSTGTTVYIPISETELTVDVSSGTTFDATFTGTDAIDEITVSKAMLNRVVS